MRLPPIHLAIIQPAGFSPSLGLLDPARYMRWHLRRLGAEVSIGKNRLREDAINFVFGADRGFDPELKRRHACIIVNLEQLGDGGAPVDANYLDLLRHSAVVDYESGNLDAYQANRDAVALVSFGFASYLQAPGLTPPIVPLLDRPIDLLFFGTINPRRQAFISHVESCGANVSLFDYPLFGPERDQYVRQAKAVLNCHFYETSRFEQVRAFHSLSLGTPVISERSMLTSVPAAFEDAVFWLEPERMAQFFTEQFGTPEWARDAEQRIAGLARHDPVDEYARLLTFATSYFQTHQSARKQELAPNVSLEDLANQPLPWKPTHLNIGSGKDYRLGWLNVDILERAQPDLVLDLGQPLTLPLEKRGSLGALVRLEEASLDLVYANNVLEHVPDLPQLMSNLLNLLKEGGDLQIEVPYEKSLTAWQDPTHLRAMNENSWLYYTEWFWYLGWFEYRFDIITSNWLDDQLNPCEKAQAAFMRLTLRKLATTPRERTVARVMQADFGGVEPDWPIDA